MPVPTSPPRASFTQRLGAFVAIAALAAALTVAGSAPATAQVGDPGEPPPVDLSVIENTPVRGWGVTGLEPDRTVNYDTQVWDFAEIGNRFYVAGAFLNVQENGNSTPISRPYLAAFDTATGDYVPEFQPQIDGPVYALEVSPRGTLLIGGEFSAIEGRADTAGVGSLDPITGAWDDQFLASVQRPWSVNKPVVRSLEVVGSDLYVAGNFSHIRGNSDNQRTRVFKVTRINASFGFPDATFKPEVQGAGVWGFGIDTANNMMHLTGFFSSVASAPGTNNFASVDLTTGALRTDLVPLQRNSTNQQDMFDVEVAAGKIWAGGSEHMVHVLDAATRTQLGWHTTGYFSPDNYSWAIPGFIGFAGGDYQVLEEIGPYVFAGCHCNEEEDRGFLSHYSSFDDERFRTLVLEAFDKNTGELVSSFVPDLAGSIEGAWAVHSDSLGCLLVGGDFSVGGIKTGSAFWLGGFARFCPPDTAGPDTESPTVPGNLTATESVGVVTLTWDASTDNRSVSGYRVTRDGVEIGFPDATTFIDADATPGFHDYRVQAEDPAGNNSAGSNVVSIEVSGPDTEPPSLPGNVTATVNGNDVTITWDASVDPSGINGYALYRDNAYLAWINDPTTTYVDSGLPNGSYDYDLRAYDTLGFRTDKTAPVTAVIGAPDTEPPTLPGNVTATANGNDVTVTWDASTDPSGVSGYAVYRNNAYIGWVNAPGTSFVDTGLADGTYDYDLRAYDTLNNRTAKTPDATVVIGAPDTEPPTLPGNLAATVNGADVTLTWDASTDPSGVSGYAVYRNGAYIGWATGPTYTDTGVAAGTYTYDLRAYDTLNNRTEKAPQPALEVTVA